MPSVRGWERARAAAVLLGAATTTAGLVGFGAGLAWGATPWDALPAEVAAGLMVAAIAADLVVAPLSVRRQVPQAWGRLFTPTGAALLYGARLGPGPLTILNTWLWWAALITAASVGPWVAAAVSATFGIGRVVVMLVAGGRAGRWRAWHRAVAVAVAAFVLGGAGVLVAGAGQPPASEPTGGPASGAATRTPDAAEHDGAPRASTRAPTGELASLLPTALDGGYRPLGEDRSKGLGPLDLATAADLEADASAERSLLETRSFEAGHARAWVRPDGRTAYAVVYRFATPADAEAYRRDGRITLEGRGVRQYPLEAPAGAFGFSQAGDGPHGGEVTHGVAFVRDRHFALVLVTAASDTSTGATEARALAVAVDRLSA